MVAASFGRGLTTTQDMLGTVAAWMIKHAPNLMPVSRKLWSYLTPSARVAANSLNGGGKRRNRYRLPAQGPVNGAPGGILRTAASVVADNFQLVNPTYYYQESLPRHEQYGDGIRICGVQNFATAQVMNTQNTFWDATNNVIRLSPDAIAGRLALLARTYDRYVFRHVALHFVPRKATTFEGVAAMAYVQDGHYLNYASVNFSSVQQVDPVVLFPMRQSAMLEINYGGDQTWYTEEDTATAAGVRITNQGELLAYVDDTTWTTGTVGTVIIEYVCDLYQPVADFGFSVFLRSREEDTLVRDLLKKIRANGSSTAGTVARRM
jgi:hypothetical protein